MTLPFKPITREHAAEELEVSLSTLDNMIASGAIPAPKSLGGRRLYWHPDIFYSYLDQQLRAAGSTGKDPKTSAEPTAVTKRSGRRTATPLGIADRARARNAVRLAKLNTGTPSNP